MDRISEFSDRIQSLQLQVQAGVDEPWRTGLLGTLGEVQLAFDRFTSSQQALSDEHITRAETRMNALIASLRRSIFPPCPADASEHTILDRKSDLIWLLDLQAPDDTLINYVLDLARKARLTGDNLTLYVLTSGPLDLYYLVRQIDTFQVHARLLRLLDGGTSARLLESFFGPDGIADLVQELKRALHDWHATREFRGTSLASRTDLRAQANFLESVTEELTSEDLDEIAAMELEVRQIAMIAGELGEPQVEMRPLAALTPYPSGVGPDRKPIPKRPSTNEETRMLVPVVEGKMPVNSHRSAFRNMAKTVWAAGTHLWGIHCPPRLRQSSRRVAVHTDANERVRPAPLISWTVRLILLVESLVVIVLVRQNSGWPLHETTTAPAASRVIGIERIGTLLPTIAQGEGSANRTLIATAPAGPSTGQTTPRSDLTQAKMPPRSLTVPPPTSTSVLAELRVIAKGFGQDQHEVGYGFVVENTSDTMVTDRTHYTVTALSAEGEVVATAWGNVGVVLPLQQQGVAGTFIDPGDTRVARIEINLATVSFHIPWMNRPLPLVTDNIFYRPNTTSPTARAVVINPEPHRLDGAFISALAYDGVGRIVGGGATEVESLPANTQTSVDVQMTASTRPTRIELYATPRSIPAGD